MKTIGFIDYYLNEWHADNYPGWIRQVNRETGSRFEVAYAWAEKEDSADWFCQKHGGQKCTSLEELCERSDCLVILAPSNPEKHLEYARIALSYGKRTYIDKTFAPDLETARKIYSCAEKNGADLFSTSALRYATELDAYAGTDSVITTGGGSSLEEYIIHQIEMIVKLLQSRTKALRVEKQTGEYIISLRYANEKQAAMIYADPLPFSILGQSAGTERYTEIRSDYFPGLIKDMLHYFETGEKSFDKQETFEVMRIREAVLLGCKKPGEWIRLEDRT